MDQWRETALPLNGRLPISSSSSACFHLFFSSSKKDDGDVDIDGATGLIHFTAMAPSAVANGGGKAVQRIDKDGSVVEEYCSASLAERRLRTPFSLIASICTGRLRSTQGYFFRYKYMWDRLDKTGAKPIIQLDEKGKVLREFDTVKAVSAFSHCSRKSISAVCNGELDQTDNGYIFKWKRTYINQLQDEHEKAASSSSTSSSSPFSFSSSSLAPFLNKR